jgi:hypothetical protein
MVGKQAQQFNSCVSCSTNDAYSDHDFYPYSEKLLSIIIRTDWKEWKL